MVVGNVTILGNQEHDHVVYDKGNNSDANLDRSRGLSVLEGTP